MQKSLPYDACKHNKLIEYTNRDPDKCDKCAWCPTTDKRIRAARIESVFRNANKRGDALNG